jgi:hypothetical protein
VARARVALVQVEVVAGERVALGAHHAVPRDLGQDRRRRDRQHAPVALHQLLRPAAADEVPVAVDQHAVGRETEAVDGAARRQPLRLRHAELVALLHRREADRPRPAPLADPVVQRLALDLGEQLRVADLVHAPVLREHGGPDGERPRPRAPPDLVDAHHDVVARLPQQALLGQRG